MHILVKNEVPFSLCPENLSKAEAKDNGLIFHVAPDISRRSGEMVIRKQLCGTRTIGKTS